MKTKRSEFKKQLNFVGGYIMVVGLLYVVICGLSIFADSVSNIDIAIFSFISFGVMGFIYSELRDLRRQLPVILQEHEQELKGKEAELRWKVESNQDKGFDPFVMYNPETGIEIPEAIQAALAVWELLQHINYPQAFDLQSREWLQQWLSTPKNALELHKRLKAIPRNAVRAAIQTWAREGSNMPPQNQPAAIA